MGGERDGSWMRVWDLAQGRRPDSARRQAQWVRTTLGPATRGEGTSSSIAQNTLIRKRLVPVVSAVEHGCHGNVCSDDVRESPRLDENVHGDSAAFSALPANGISAMADSV